MVLARAVHRALPVLLVLVWSASAYSQSSPELLLGRVLSADRKPINGAKVSLFGDYRSIDSVKLCADGATDSEGKFQIKHEATRELLAIVQAPGFGLCAFSIPGDQEDEPLEILVPAATTVRVKVVDLSGNPAARIRVAPFILYNRTYTPGSILPNALMQQLAQTSDASGVCTFANLPQQTQIIFSAADDQMVGRSPQIQTGAVSELNVSDAMRISPGGIIQGRVLVGDSGLPAEGIEVVNQNTAENGSRFDVTTIADAEGRFRFKQVLAGSCVLKLKVGYPLAEQFASYTSEPFPLVPGQVLDGKDIKLLAGTLIRGTTTMENTGLPVANVSVRVLVQTDPGSWEDVASTKSRSDGTYLLNVAPGRYRMLATPNSRTGLAGVVDRLAPPFDLEGGKTIDANFAFRPNPSAERRNIAPVRGTVVDPLGQPVEGATVSLSYGTDYHLQDVVVVTGPPSNTASMGNGSTTVTDARGHFELPIAGNEALLRVRKGSLALAKPVAIGADRNLKLSLLDNTAGAVRVLVVDDAGKPLAGAQVLVRVSNGIRSLAPRWGNTDAEGAFNLSPIHPDRNYRVQVERDGYTTATTPFNAESGKSIELPPLKLYKADSSITGTVVNDAGEAMAGISVMVSNSIAGNKSTSSDAAGRFIIDKLVAGRPVSIRTSQTGAMGDARLIEPGTKDLVLVHSPRSFPGRGPSPRNAAPTTRQQ